MNEVEYNSIKKWLSTEPIQYLSNLEELKSNLDKEEKLKLDARLSEWFEDNKKYLFVPGYLQDDNSRPVFETVFKVIQHLNLMLDTTRPALPAAKEELTGKWSNDCDLPWWRHSKRAGDPCEWLWNTKRAFEKMHEIGGELLKEFIKVEDGKKMVSEIIAQMNPDGTFAVGGMHTSKTKRRKHKRKTKRRKHKYNRRSRKRHTSKH